MDFFYDAGGSVEAHGNERGDPLLLDRDAVEAVRDFHCFLVVGNHEDLGVGRGFVWCIGLSG